LTVEPDKEIINQYIDEFYNTILKNNNANLAIMGPQQVYIDLTKLPKQIHLFKTVDAFKQEFLEVPILV
jgi:hypothetical protein